MALRADEVPAQIAETVFEYNAGWTVERIAEVHNISRPAAYARLRAAERFFGIACPKRTNRGRPRAGLVA